MSCLIQIHKTLISLFPVKQHYYITLINDRQMDKLLSFLLISFPSLIRSATRNKRENWKKFSLCLRHRQPVEQNKIGKKLLNFLQTVDKLFSIIR